jgi:glycolate oxidase
MTEIDTRAAALATLVSSGAVLADRDLVASYRQDWAKDPNAGWPLAVVRATTTPSHRRLDVHRAFAAVMDLAIELGGTITGEHGVGRLKRDWLPAHLGPDAMALTRRIQDAIDSDWILNPGAVLAKARVPSTESEDAPCA